MRSLYPTVVPAGGTFVATVTGDPETVDGPPEDVFLTGEVEYQSGQVASVEGAVQVVSQVDDPIVDFRLIDRDGVGVQITERAAEAGVFDCVLPTP